eukprot:3541675-Amphidinium_carterae.1
MGVVGGGARCYCHLGSRALCVQQYARAFSSNIARIAYLTRLVYHINAQVGLKAPWAAMGTLLAWRSYSCNLGFVSKIELNGRWPWMIGGIIHRVRCKYFLPLGKQKPPISKT